MATKYHVVKKGELPSGICKKYGISLSQLVKLNNLKKNNSILKMAQIPTII